MMNIEIYKDIYLYIFLFIYLFLYISFIKIERDIVFMNTIID